MLIEFNDCRARQNQIITDINLYLVIAVVDWRKPVAVVAPCDQHVIIVDSSSNVMKLWHHCNLILQTRFNVNR